MSRLVTTSRNLLVASADPATPTLRSGDTYFNSSSKAIRTYDGSIWHESIILDQPQTISGLKTITTASILTNVNTTNVSPAITIGPAGNATSSSTSYTPGTLRWNVQYWNGSASTSANIDLFGMVLDTAGTTRLRTNSDFYSPGTITGNNGIYDGAARVYSSVNTPPYPVSSVATRTGAVTLTIADIAAGTSPTGTFNFPGTLQMGGNTVLTSATTIVSSVAGRSGGVILTAADIGAGTFPGASTFSGLITANAGITLPSGQALTTGTRSVFTGTRATTTNASDTVDLGTFTSTGGAIELRIHTHLAAPAAGSTASVTKVYEFAVSSTMGTASTWYLVYPADSSANAGASNDFALEVQRTAAGTFQFRFRQKSIAVAGTIAFTVEALGDTVVAFTPSTTITSAPAAVSTMHQSNPIVAAAGSFGVGTEAPGALLDVNGAIRSTVLYAGATIDTAHDAASSWVAYTPTATNFTVGNGTLAGAYKIIGKTMFIRISFTAGTTTTYTASQFKVSLPAGVTAAGEQSFISHLAPAGTAFIGLAKVSATGTVFNMRGPTSTSVTTSVQVDSTHPGTWGATSASQFDITGVVEIT